MPPSSGLCATIGRKVSDEWVVPLCNLHHRSLHDSGNEEAWWGEHRIDAVSESQRLWEERRSPGPLPAPARPEGADSTPTAIEEPQAEPAAGALRARAE